VCVLAGILVRSVLKRALARVAERSKTPFAEVVAGGLPRPAGIAVFLLGVAAGLRWVPLRESLALQVRRLFPIALGVLAIVALMRISLRAIQAYGKANPELRSSAGIGRAATWIIGLAAIALFVSDALGISLAPALTALGVGSLAVGLGLQDTLSNFFAGLYLLADKPLRPGDYVSIDSSHEGFVETIGWRSTQLRTGTNNLVVVPNAVLSKAVLINFSRPDERLAVEVRIDVAADADTEVVASLLAEEAGKAKEIDGVLPEPAPKVRLQPGWAAGAISWAVLFDVRSFKQKDAVVHELRTRILKGLRKARVALPPAMK
jgi:small-conductance mechanosensitive channel